MSELKTIQTTEPKDKIKQITQKFNANVNTISDLHKWGNGSPEGVIVANIGCLYQDLTNGVQYQKKSDSGKNTGWSIVPNLATYASALDAGLVKVGNGLSINTNGVLYSHASPGMLAKFQTLEPPEGWLVRDGSVLNRESYSDLYNAIKLVNGLQFYVSDIINDIILLPNCPFSTGDSINVFLAENLTYNTTAELPSGLLEDTIYYVRKIDGNTLSLYNTSANASTGGSTGRINIASYGVGTHKIWHSSTFPLDDARGEFDRGADLGRNVDSSMITGTTTSGNNAITSVSSIAGLFIGQPISGSGILSGTTITAITSTNSIVISKNATASASGVLLTITGRAFGSWEIDDLKSHTHSFRYSQENGGGKNYWTNSAGFPADWDQVYNDGNLWNNAINLTGGLETRSRNIASLACIKY